MASRRLLALPVIIAALALGACGSRGDPAVRGRPELRGRAASSTRTAPSATRSTCAGAQGSATDVGSRERKDGPNFNERKESVDDVLYAIRNGGFSSSPMPQNIVTGEDAQKVAEFVAEYSGGGGSE